MPPHFDDNYIAPYVTTTATAVHDGWTAATHTYTLNPYSTVDLDGDNVAVTASNFNQLSLDMLKPLIEEILREILEQEGYIVGRLPKEEPGEI